jgi:hypothetical protein
MERAPHNQDIWGQRWGDSTFQDLGRWLTSHNVPDQRAVLAIDSLWIFYSYDVLPTLGRRTPLGIAANGTKEHAHSVWVYLPSLSRPYSAPAIESTQIGVLREAFADQVADRLASNLSMRLELLSLPLRSQAEFEQELRNLCWRQQRHYIGIFNDKLEDELSKIMQPDVVGAWLDTPNSLFAGAKPSELLGIAERDRPLRDLILTVKHGMVS